MKTPTTFIKNVGQGLNTLEKPNATVSAVALGKRKPKLDGPNAKPGLIADRTATTSAKRPRSSLRTPWYDHPPSMDDLDYL
jgi:hypothetical protein